MAQPLRKREAQAPWEPVREKRLITGTPAMIRPMPTRAARRSAMASSSTCLIAGDVAASMGRTSSLMYAIRSRSLSATVRSRLRPRRCWVRHLHRDNNRRLRRWGLRVGVAHGTAGSPRSSGCKESGSNQTAKSRCHRQSLHSSQPPQCHRES
jgi:hypothetical protein